MSPRTTGAPVRGGLFRAIRVRNYRLFASGQVVSLIGIWTEFTAQDWTVLRLSHNSGSALGWVTALQFTPIVLLTLYGGKLADRYDKRTLLRLTHIGAGLVAVTLGVLALTGTIGLWQVMVLAAVLGTISAIDTPTRQAFVSELVEPELLPNAIALNGVVFNTSRIVGPALAGVAISVFDTGPVFLLAGVTSMVAFTALSLMRPVELHRATGPRPARTQVVDGLRYAAKRPDLLLPMALMAVIGAVGFNFELTLALVSKTVFHRSAATFGLLTTALAAGALVGALASGRRTRRPTATVVIGAAFGFGATELLAGLAPDYVSAAGLLAVTGFFMIMLAQAASQRVQLGVSEEYRGRVMALYLLVFQGTTPIFAPVIGWLAQVLGARSALWLGGAASLLATTLVFAYRSRSRGVARRSVRSAGSGPELDETAVQSRPAGPGPPVG